MREIKFRAWVIAEKRMIYHPALLELSILEYDWASVCIGYKPGTDPDDYERKTIPCIHTLSNIGYGLVELMQFIGRKDKNGRKIFERDIVLSRNIRKEKVFWLDCGAWHPFAGDGDGATLCLSEECEVLGSIFEHPELVPK